VNIQRQPGANVIAVVDRIQRLLPQLPPSLPAAVEVSVLTDRTATIRASVEDVQFRADAVGGAGRAGHFLFLRTVPATLIPAVAVPLSLVGTFGAMVLWLQPEQPVADGAHHRHRLVVDDAIVMIENIAR